jgi:putative protein kinase ArgK-like GTPase of G3E family
MKTSNINKMTLKGAEELLKTLKAKLTADEDMWEGEDWRTEIGYEDDHDENSIYNLSNLVDCLENYCEDGDEFGTEGWQHRYDF